MALLRRYPRLGMLSPQVDQIWHSLILNTIRYREFCSQYIGRFVDHLPCSSYDLYGFSVDSICEEPPATCTDPWPAPPDPSPLPDPPPTPDPSHHDMHTIIEQGSSRFIDTYTLVFGVTPDVSIWPRTAQVSALAQ
jgi:hypothetical protein